MRGEGKEYDFMLRDKAYYLINPGAVGQPRDQDERAAYTIYDARRDRVSFYRVVYDTAAASRKIVAAGCHLLWLSGSNRDGKCLLEVYCILFIFESGA